MKNMFLIVLVLGIGGATIFAEEAKPVLKTSLNLGATVTRGNSETMLLNASWLTEGEKQPLGAARVGAEANYGASTVAEKEETTVDNAKLFAGAEKTLSPRTFAALNGSLSYDNIADIDYRAILGPGLGVYIWRGERGKWMVQAGPSYLWEKIGGARRDFTTLQAIERFEFQFSETAKIWQSAEWLPRVDAFEDYLLNVEVGAEAALTTRLKLRVVLQDKYNSVPAENKKHNDLTLIAGLGVSL